MEYNAWGSPPNPPELEANLVYTRMLSGPMDFTPGVLSLVGKDGLQIQSTIAKQLAPNGRFAGAIVDRGVTRLVVGRVANGSLGLRSLADADVALLPGFERPRAFTF